MALRPTTPTRDEQWLFALRQGEQVYFSAGGALVEVRRRQGQSVLRVTQEGDIALTTRGLVFHGSKRVRWDFPQISGVEWDVDPDHDSVLISTHTRVNPSGLLFGELPVDPRLAFQVAQAASRGQKQHLIASLDREIASLEAQRPLFAG